jgi:hypothetical protein
MLRMRRVPPPSGQQLKLQRLRDSGSFVAASAATGGGKSWQSPLIREHPHDRQAPPRPRRDRPRPHHRRRQHPRRPAAKAIFAQRPVNLFRSGKIPAVISQCQVLGRTLERFSGRFPTEQIAMLGPTKVAVSFALVAFSLMTEGTTTNAESKLPDLSNVGVAEKLFRLDCGRALANDESVWTPGENVGRSIEFSSTC